MASPIAVQSTSGHRSPVKPLPVVVGSKLYYRLLVSGAPIGRGLAEEIADAVLPLRRPAGA